MDTARRRALTRQIAAGNDFAPASLPLSLITVPAEVAP